LAIDLKILMLTKGLKIHNLNISTSP
jgi:hypothetical protein